MVRERAGREDPPTILIVDDDPDLAALFGRWLADEYDVVIAHGGRDALETMSREAIDLLVLDRQLPDFPGELVLQRARDRAPGLPIILVNGMAWEPGVSQLDADDNLRKPVDADTLRAAVRAQLHSVTAGER